MGAQATLQLCADQSACLRSSSSVCRAPSRQPAAQSTCQALWRRWTTSRPRASTPSPARGQCRTLAPVPAALLATAVTEDMWAQRERPLRHAGRVAVCHHVHSSLQGGPSSHAVMCRPGARAQAQTARSPCWQTAAASLQRSARSWTKARPDLASRAGLGHQAVCALQAIGVDLDLSDKGLGVRSRRYTMLVDDGVVGPRPELGLP